MVVLLFGPPGCGKGTQSPRIAQRLGIPAISTGEILRTEELAQTPLGLAAAELVADGNLVSDEMANFVLSARLQSPDCAEGFLLDGYPRTVPQAAFLKQYLDESGLPDPLILHLHTPDHVLIDRISARRECPTCRRVYNLRLAPPRSPDHCDVDRMPLLHRQDDQAQTVAKRLRTYAATTNPVLSFYSGRGYHCLDGNRPADAIFAEIERILAQVWPDRVALAS